VATNLETIWAAVAQRLADETTSFGNHVSRRERQWGMDQLPAIELYDNGDEDDIGDEEDPRPLWQATGEILILAHTPASAESPTTQLNNLIYEVRTALERKPTDSVGSGPRASSPVGFWSNLGIQGLSISIGRTVKGSAGEKTGIAMAKMEITVTTY
jgi:hypothetical protein